MTTGWDAQQRGDLPPVCILAGGLGTRLGGLASRTPKALMRVSGEPFLLHQLRLLAAAGFTNSVVCVGHLGEQVRSTIGERRFGIDLSYSFDSPELDGTLGALRRAAAVLGERFLVMYGDTYLRVDFAGFYRQWLDSRLPAGMVVLHNKDRWGRSNAIFGDGMVRAYDKVTPTPSMEWIDYGLGALTTSCLFELPTDQHDLASLYNKLAEDRRLFGFEATERFYEIGTPEALADTSEFLSSLPGHRGGASPATGGGGIGSYRTPTPP